jgi:hypothetical protein
MTVSRVAQKAAPLLEASLFQIVFCGVLTVDGEHCCRDPHLAQESPAMAVCGELVAAVGRLPFFGLISQLASIGVMCHMAGACVPSSLNPEIAERDTGDRSVGRSRAERQSFRVRRAKGKPAMPITIRARHLRSLSRTNCDISNAASSAKMKRAMLV